MTTAVHTKTWMPLLADSDQRHPGRVGHHLWYCPDGRGYVFGVGLAMFWTAAVFAFVGSPVMIFASFR
jgi:hypothetical protein